jgi:hypothetical protein
VKKLLVLLPLLVGGATAIAQTNFRPGYVVPLSGDTLRGEVDSRGAQRNARLARFRASKDAAITEYLPQQLKGYGFTNDRVYQSAVVILSDSIKRNSLIDVEVKPLPRPSYLEVMVLGPATLLYLRDDNSNDHFYLLLQDGVLQELIQTTQQVVENGVTYQRKSDDFRRTLASAMQQCPAVQPTINHVRFGMNELTRVVQNYNECVGGTSLAPADASRKSHVRLGVIAGAETSRLVINNPVTGAELLLKGKASPVVGLALNINLAGLNKVFSARLEALYESQSYSKSNVSYRDAYGYTIDRQYHVELASLRVPLLVRYTYPEGTVRPFVQLGYGFNYMFRNTNETRYRYSNPSASEDFTRWSDIATTRKLEQGIITGVGLATTRPDKRNLAVELRFERSDGFSEDVAVGSRVNRGYILLSYDLTK